MMNKIKISALLVILATFMACHPSEENTKAMHLSDTIPVRLLNLTEVADVAKTSTSGFLSTDDETALSFKNGGVIAKLYVKEGDAITKGQLLAQLNPTEINAQVQQVKLGFEKAERDLNRAKKLYSDSVATKEQLENAQTAFRLASEQKKAAEFNQQYAEIRASRSGFVLKRMANEGQIVGPGMPVILINGASESSWLLKVGLTDKQWTQLKIGDKAAITLDAFPSQSFEGRVSEKSKSIDPQSGTFGANIQLINPTNRKVATGMFGKAIISSSEQQKQIEVPYDAILDAGEGKAYLFVANGTVARKIAVSLGELQQNRVVITKGLNANDQVIVSGSAYLRDGSIIKVMK